MIGKENILPKNWKWEKLENALDFVIGGDWGKDEYYEDENYGYAYCIRGSEIKNWEEQKGRTATLRKVKLPNIEKRKLIEGDILVEISGGGPDQPVGRTVLIDKSVLNYKPEIPKICTNFLRLIRPKNYVEGKYLNLYLKLFYYSGEIVKYQGGSNNLRNLKFPDYLKISFPLPPKPIQQKIVSKIEELFSELDKGIENLHLAQQQLKTYRQSVLKWAFEGRLTNENVKEGELPKGWKKVKIKEVAETYGGYAFKSGDFLKKGKYQVIRMGNVRPGVLRYDENPVFLDKVDASILDRSLLQINDVIITQTGTRKKRDYGFTTLIKSPNLLLNQRIASIRCKDKYLPKFLLYYTWTDFFKDQYFLNETGNVGQGNVGMKAINETLTPICSVTEQNSIVQEIERRLSEVEKMEEIIIQCLKQAEALRQSILKKAFKGRLINIT